MASTSSQVEPQKKIDQFDSMMSHGLDNSTQQVKMLRLSYYNTPSFNVTIEVGEKGCFSTDAHSLTWVERNMIAHRDVNDIRTITQPRELIFKLTEIFARAAPNIEEVIVGGPGTIFDDTIHHWLVITKDFLLTLNKLTSMKSLKICRCQIDKDAVELRQLTFITQLTKLSLNRVELDQPFYPAMLIGLMSNRLEELEIIDADLVYFGSLLVDQMRQHNKTFKKLTFDIFDVDVDKMIVARDNLIALNRVCDSMDLRFTAREKQNSAMQLGDNVFEMMGMKGCWLKLCSLTVDADDCDVRHFAEILSGLRLQKNLEYLKIGGLFVPELCKILRQALRTEQKPKILHLRNTNPLLKIGELIEELIEHLPSSLTGLELDGFPMNFDIMNMIQSKYAESLEKLAIKCVNQSDEMTLFPMCLNFKKLQCFSTNMMIPLCDLHIVLAIKNLKKATLVINKCSDVELNRVIESYNFVVFTKWQANPFGSIFLELIAKNSAAAPEMECMIEGTSAPTSERATRE